MTTSDFRDREHWSYSSLNQILNICGLQWTFQRLYRLTPEFKPVALSFGSAFHRALEWFARNRQDGQTPKATEARELFTDLWQRQLAEDGEVRFDEETDANTLSAQGRDMLACFVTQTDPEERVCEVNRTFCIPLVDANGQALEKPLIGEMDCVVEKNGERLIVDWKTSVRRWPADKAHKDLQPTAYLLAAGLTTPEQAITRFRFDVIVKNKTPVFEQHHTTRTPDQCQRLVIQAQVAERIIAQELFLPSEQGFYCNGCGFQSACKAWHRNQARTISLAA